MLSSSHPLPIVRYTFVFESVLTIARYTLCLATPFLSYLSVICAPTGCCLAIRALPLTGGTGA